MKRLGPDDYEEAARILLNESILPFVMDDGIVDHETMLKRCLRMDAVYFLMPDPDSLFLYVPVNCITWQIHANVLPESRGNGARLFSDTLAYMFEDTPCRKIIAMVPVCNPRANRMGRKCGFIQEGLIRGSWKLNDQVFDVILDGLRKEDFIWLGSRQQ